jgi:hypothetical protein
MKQAFARSREGLYTGAVLALCEHLTNAKCHRFQRRTSAILEEDEHGKRRVARNCHLYMKCSDNVQRRRAREFKPAINIPQQTTTEPE